ncbi:hypothetical protein IFM47457_00323 [Aspergillus lentulus]|nr:hypothetical protein IFM47457_00323 [Aspergillus lentulus]
MLIGHDVSDSANNTAVHRDTLKYKNLVHMKLLRAAFQDPTTDASCKETRNIKRQTQTSSSVRWDQPQYPILTATEKSKEPEPPEQAVEACSDGKTARFIQV